VKIRRKKTVSKDPRLVEDLERLVEPLTRGDPESPLRWTCKSLRKLAEELARQGHQVSHQLGSRGAARLGV
jgi:Rhodopirellula transposase DDE domain